MKAKLILGFAIVSLTMLGVLHINEVKANPEDTRIIADIETENATDLVDVEPIVKDEVSEPMETETETTFDYACIVIETTEDIVTVEYNGNLYDFYGDGFKVGNVVMCTFTDNMEIIDAYITEIDEIAFFDVPLAKEIQIHIFVECTRHNISPALVIAMIEMESYYDPSNIGDNGDSFGLMQVQPKWHTPRMKHLGCTDLFNPYQNITVGIDYLVELRDEYGLTEICDVLMGYNGGPDYADDMISQGKISDYALRVSERASELSLEYYGE